MANTYHQIHIQTVFAVKYRQGLILPTFKDELFAYMSQIIQKLGHKSLIVNGVQDHVHCFFGLNPRFALADLMRDVKANSSRWINENNWLKHRFEWQEGYGAFSYAKSQTSRVCQYIQNQELHHQTRTFQSEYLQLLQKFEIEHEEKYTFHAPL